MPPEVHPRFIGAAWSCSSVPAGWTHARAKAAAGSTYVHRDVEDVNERDYRFSIAGQRWTVSCDWRADQQAAIEDACSRAATSIRPSE